MKKFKTLIALLLALLALPMCLFACEEGGGGEQTVDPNDTTDGLLVDVIISSSEQGELVPFIKTSKDTRVQPGTTLLDAVKALCEERGATMELDTIGAFMSFTWDGVTIKSENKLVGEDESGLKTFKPVEFKVLVNGTEIKTTEIAAYAINHRDVIEINLVEGEEFTAKE